QHRPLRRPARHGPHPPAAAALPDRHAAAGRLRPRRGPRREGQGAPRAEADVRAGSAGAHRPRPVHRRHPGGAAGARLRRRARRRRPQRHRDLRRPGGRGGQLALGRRPVLPAHRQADGAPLLRDRGAVPRRAAPDLPRPGRRPQPAGHPAAAGGDHPPAHARQGARRGRAAAAPGAAGAQLRRHLRGPLPRRLRAAADGRDGRRPDPVHAPRRGGGRLALDRPDHLRLAGQPARALRPRRHRPRRRAPAARPLRPELAGLTPRPPDPCTAGSDPVRRAHPDPPHRYDEGAPPLSLHPRIADVTEGLAARSAASRAAYLERIRAAAEEGPARAALGCANLAHGIAACPVGDKLALSSTPKPNIAIVSAYNDMLSAHQPLHDYPAVLKRAVAEAGGVAQFAGGVPAMCDGITQGRAGMELSLYSRDVIAMATAIALSHDMFDGALMLGVCDKIVPGLLIGALSFGHLPVAFVPAGPMPSGLPNKEKARVRQRFAEGKADRTELLQAESAAYHSPGTCTFYGTANSNQMLMEVMGLHLPGASFEQPGTPMREALTAEAGRRVVGLTA